MVRDVCARALLIFYKIAPHISVPTTTRSIELNNHLMYATHKRQQLAIDLFECEEKCNSHLELEIGLARARSLAFHHQQFAGRFVVGTLSTYTQSFAFINSRKIESSFFIFSLAALLIFVRIQNEIFFPSAACAHSFEY